MRDRRAERRLMLEAIIDDPAASHSDRLRADEQLRELEIYEQRTSAAEHLTASQALAEAESLAQAMPGIVALARVAAGEDPDDVIEAPTDPAEATEVIDLQQRVIERLEASLLERETALAYEHRHRLLSAAVEVAL